MVKEIVEEIPEGIKKEKEFRKEEWNPKTSLGRKIASKDITEIDEVFDKGYKILEPQIVDALIPNLESELLSLGQSKCKFGGGKRSI